MIKVFIDSSVFIAASGSISGTSAHILQYAKEKKINCYFSLFVINETQKNVNFKMNELAKKRLQFYLKNVSFIAIEPNEEEIKYCNAIINLKDAPILAAAFKSKVSYLLTFDRKHFFEPNVIKSAKAKNLKILTPADFVNLSLTQSQT